MVQLIGRGVQHLPTTPLEFFTLGIVVCTLFTYTVFWYAPQDIRQPVLISTDKPLCEFFNRGVPSRSRVHFFEPVTGVRNHNQREKLGIAISAGIVASLFGVCHILAWNFSFPSSIEQLLWRIASVFCIVLPVGVIVLAYNGYVSLNPDIVVWSVISILLIYCLVRVILLVEVFASLRSIPAGVYQTVDWSLYIPHL